MRLRYAPRARTDIVEIHDDIAKHNLRAATTVIQRIRATGRLLERHPGLARDTNIAGVRVLLVVRYPFLIYHRLTKKEVVVIHIRHASRDIPTPSDFQMR